MKRLEYHMVISIAPYPLSVRRHSSLGSFTILFIVRLFENKEITKTYLSGTHSCVLVIPKNIARHYKIDSPSHVVVEGTEQGILIKKLNLEELRGI